jgi:hypothetical protein
LNIQIFSKKLTNVQYCRQTILQSTNHASFIFLREKATQYFIDYVIEYWMLSCLFVSFLVDRCFRVINEWPTDTNSFKKYHQWRVSIPRTCVKMFKLIKISIILWNLKQIFGASLLIFHLNLKWTSQLFVFWISFNLKRYPFSLSFPPFSFKVIK